MYKFIWMQDRLIKRRTLTNRTLLRVVRHVVKVKREEWAEARNIANQVVRSELWKTTGSPEHYTNCAAQNWHGTTLKWQGAYCVLRFGRFCLNEKDIQYMQVANYLRPKLRHCNVTFLYLEDFWVHINNNSRYNSNRNKCNSK